MSEKSVKEAFALAAERYSELGVDAEAAIKAADAVPLSIHCWQGDDVGGFERAGAELSGGGIQCRVRLRKGAAGSAAWLARPICGAAAPRCAPPPISRPGSEARAHAPRW